MIQRYQECRRQIEEIWDRGAVAYVNLKAYALFEYLDDPMKMPFPILEAIKHLSAIYDPGTHYALFVAKAEEVEK